MFYSELLDHSPDPIDQTESGVQISRHSVSMEGRITLVWKTFWFPELGNWLGEASARPVDETITQAEQEAFRAEEDALNTGVDLIVAKLLAFRASDAVFDASSRSLANEYFALRAKVLAAPQAILIHDLGLSGALWQSVALWLAEHGMVVHVPSRGMAHRNGKALGIPPGGRLLGRVTARVCWHTM